MGKETHEFSGATISSVDLSLLLKLLTIKSQEGGKMLEGVSCDE